MRRIFALSLIITLFVTANLFAVGEARMTGKLLDADTKQPIADGVLKIEATSGKTVRIDQKSKKDGSFTIFVLDGTLMYKFTISAPGYATYEETIKLQLGETNIRNFELNKPGQAAGPPPEKAVADPAVEAYNAGAALSNNGDSAGALAKFEEAVALKPDLTAGWMALAKVAVKQKQYQKAIDAAKKGLEIDDEDTDMWLVLFQSYKALGDNANAAAAEKKLPVNASKLFNEAAKLINEGKDGEAEDVLKRAVVADEKMGIAWYELGMVYARTGKNAEAKQALNKYLELDPKGKDAPTAREMLGYLP
ncbi:MAG TPA: tetratricopeptide repeat protein [Thermoanaerobaculia bacterium]|jgi:tetratricopeptide (TPR) repeat protein|nr:tetratricopeptide repeat protein [Thermoanaerobaculia bacterium]